MTPNDIPGYLQGFRFSDDPQFYDSTAKHFYDLAGYDARGNGCDVLLGTPTFSTRNSKRAIALDNTCHLAFLSTIPWQGATLFIYDVEVLTATFTTYLVLTGATGSLSAKTFLRLQRGSGTLKHRWAGLGGTLFTEVTTPGPLALGAATSQTSRTAFLTTDGVSVSETAPVAGTNGSNASFFVTSSFDDASFRSVIGNLSGTPGDTTAVTSCKVHLWEAHFFKGNPYVDNASAMAALIAAKKTEYGIV
jgi:hypothetical protein